MSDPPRPACTHLAHPNGFPVSTPSATIRCAPQTPASTSARRLTPSTGPRGDSCGFQDCRSRLKSRAARRSPPMPPSWLRTFRPAWRALGGWPAQTPVGHDPTESSGRQPEPETGVRRMSAAAGPGGGAALVGASVAPPPILPPPTDSREHSERPVDAGQCARLRALSATLPTPDREIILLWAVAGVSTPDIAATLGVTPAAVRRAPKQGIERTATCGDRQWPFTSHPAAGGAAAPRSKPPDNRRAGSTPVVEASDLPTTGDLAESDS